MDDRLVYRCPCSREKFATVAGVSSDQEIPDTMEISDTTIWPHRSSNIRSDVYLARGSHDLGHDTLSRNLGSVSAIEACLCLSSK